MTSHFDLCSNSMHSPLELCTLGSNLDLLKKKKKKKKNDCRGAGSLSTCRRYVLSHYFEGLMEFTCVAGEIRRTAMSKQRKK